MSAPLFVVAFVLLLWVPGHLLLRLSGDVRERVPRWSWTEGLYGEVALSALLILWTGVTLGGLGFFSRASLVGCGAVSSVGLALLVARREGPLLRRPSRRPDALVLLVVALVGVAALWYRPAFEQVAGGRDPVTYVLSGIYMGREGSWVVQDDVVTTIESDVDRRTFLGTVRAGAHGHWGPRFLGWYLMDPDTGRVVPQGLPLYPTTIAIGYLLGGVQGALRVTTILAIAAVVGLLLLGRRLSTTAVGATAAAWLLVSPAQVWFARFANAETVAQLLVIVGLYGFVIHRRHGSWPHGLLAGVAFGLTWQSHIWMVWLVLPLAGIFVTDVLRDRIDRSALLAFWLPLFLLGVQALVIYLTVTTAYLWGVYSVLRWSLPAIIPAFVGAALVLAIMWYWRRRRSAPAGPPSPEVRSVGWTRVVVAAAVVAAALFGYAVRPLVSNAWSAEAVPRLTLTTGVPVFALAVAGMGLLLLDRRRGAVTLCVLAIALGIMVPVLWHPSIQRPLMWSLRRYQTFLPLIYLFAAVPLWRWVAAERLSALRWRDLAAAAVAVAVLVPQGLRGQEYRGFKQPGETIALIEEIADSLEPDAVLLFEARSGWGVLDFAAPLAYWKGFEVYRLHSKTPSAVALRDFTRRQTQRGRPVYFFTQGFTYFFAAPRAEPHRRWWYQRRQLEEVLGRMPESVVDSRFLFAAYRLLPTGVNGPLDGGIDVGNWDDIYVGEALATEIVGPLTVRWTKGTAYFWLPGMPADVQRIVVHADTVADSEHLGRTLRARLDGVDLGEIPITAGWPDYIFDVPSDWQPVAGRVPMLELVTVPIQPDAVVGNGDSRYLGVLVNAVLWQ
jgi:hypothetical protein